MNAATNQIICLEDHSEVLGTVEDINTATELTHPTLPEDAHFCGMYDPGNGAQKLHVFYSESWRQWMSVSSLTKETAHE